MVDSVEEINVRDMTVILGEEEDLDIQVIIMKTRLYKYIENFTFKKLKIFR